MNEIVKYENQLNATPLRNFKAVDLDFLMLLCHKFREKGTEVIKFDLSEVRELANYKFEGHQRFIDDLMGMNRKLLNCDFLLRSENKIVQFVLFSYFEIDPKEYTLEVAVNSRFAFLLNELGREFTRFELKEFVGLKSSYAKECYRRLKQFRTQGWWEISIEEFRRLLDVAPSYKTGDIDKRVLKPIEKELTPLFKNFKLIKKYKKGRGRGGKVVSALRFEFKAEKVPKKENSGLERNFERTEYRKTGMKCPACGEILYEAVLNGNNCWCHNLKEQGDDCKKIYNSIAEIKELPEHPERGLDEDDISDKEYSRKLIKEMIKKLG